MLPAQHDAAPDDAPRTLAFRVPARGRRTVTFTLSNRAVVRLRAADAVGVDTGAGPEYPGASRRPLARCAASDPARLSCQLHLSRVLFRREAPTLSTPHLDVVTRALGAAVDVQRDREQVPSVGANLDPPVSSVLSAMLAGFDDR